MFRAIIFLSVILAIGCAAQTKSLTNDEICAMKNAKSFYLAEYPKTKIHERDEKVRIHVTFQQPIKNNYGDFVEQTDILRFYDATKTYCECQGGTFVFRENFYRFDTQSRRREQLKEPRSKELYAMLEKKFFPEQVFGRLNKDYLKLKSYFNRPHSKYKSAYICDKDGKSLFYGTGFMNVEPAVFQSRREINCFYFDIYETELLTSAR